MRVIEPMLSVEYDADVEHKLQILTKQAYISQIDAARVIGCASSTVGKVFKNLGIEKNEFYNLGIMQMPNVNIGNNTCIDCYFVVIHYSFINLLNRLSNRMVSRL